MQIFISVLGRPSVANLMQGYGINGNSKINTVDNNGETHGILKHEKLDTENHAKDPEFEDPSK